MSLKLRGFEQFDRTIDPKVLRPLLRDHIRRKSILNGLLAEALIQRRISGRVYAPNAALTAALKGSSLPLVDRGALMQSITSQVSSDGMEVLVGVFATGRVRAGRGSSSKASRVSIATILHEGAVIKVTPRMRAYFKRLASERSGRTKRGRSLDIAPLKASTTVIVIPARPFIREAIGDKRFLTQARNNWLEGIQEAFREARR